MNGTQGIVTVAQTVDIDGALYLAGNFSWAARLITKDQNLKRGCRLAKFAFLNRACELASVPLAQYYAEYSNGDLDLAWITYRPEAVSTGPRSIPDAIVYLGSVDNLTEDQARSRAIGW